MLQGDVMSHVDAVVNSAGAVLLSLTYSDFEAALKGVLGLSHQDRMIYLRMHPLFVDVPLEDIDAATDHVVMTAHPAGSQLYPPPPGSEHKVTVRCAALRCLSPSADFVIS
jgi:hypothetical protein